MSSEPIEAALITFYSEDREGYLADAISADVMASSLEDGIGAMVRAVLAEPEFAGAVGHPKIEYGSYIESMSEALEELASAHEAVLDRNLPKDAVSSILRLGRLYLENPMGSSPNPYSQAAGAFVAGFSSGRQDAAALGALHQAVETFQSSISAPFWQAYGDLIAYLEGEGWRFDTEPTRIRQAIRASERIGEPSESEGPSMNGYVEACWRITESYPHLLQGWLRLAWALGKAGDWDNSQRAAYHAHELEPDEYQRLSTSSQTALKASRHPEPRFSGNGPKNLAKRCSMPRAGPIALPRSQRSSGTPDGIRQKRFLPMPGC